ncbi:MAG: hypothetical protein AB1411_07430 [Nitrospirota bacterium]
MRASSILFSLNLILLAAAGWFAAQARAQPAPAQEAPLVQVLRAPDWKGGVESSEGECGATSGEFSFWVYATATRCGVPREQAERVVSVRQPAPGIAPLTARATLPGGRYAVWVYGMGQPGHPWVILCGKTCVQGEVPPQPGWALVGWVETRENQLLFFRTWQQPEAHRLDVLAVVISSSGAKPDWRP